MRNDRQNQRRCEKCVDVQCLELDESAVGRFGAASASGIGSPKGGIELVPLWSWTSCGMECEKCKLHVSGGNRKIRSWTQTDRREDATVGPNGDHEIPN